MFLNQKQTRKSLLPALIIGGLFLLWGCASSSQSGGHADGMKSLAMGGKSIMISDSWVRAAPPVSKRAAGYMIIKNMGSADDILLGAKMDRPGMIEVHGMRKVGTMMEMYPLPHPIVIPAGGMMMLKPGGNHLMMMNLAGGPQIGEMVTFTLTFKNAGTITQMAPVRESAEMGGKKMKH